MSSEINLTGPAPDPITFQGPLNVFIQLQGTAAAYVRAAEIKQAYDNVVPAPAPANEPAEVIDPAPEPAMMVAAPEPELRIVPIPAGREFVPDSSKYVIDTDIRRRLK